MRQEKTSVLVVGGGLAGLSSALFLASRGVAAVLVEKHASSSPHPRAAGFTARTVELLHTVGLGEDLPTVSGQGRLARARIESLAGEWFETTDWTPRTDERPPVEYSPYRGAVIAQDGLEPILRQRAIELGADIRLSTAFESFSEDADGITAILRNADGTEYRMQAGYLIAADGHRSGIGERLGIGRTGRGYIQTMRSVLFRADLERYLERGVRQFDIDQPDFKAFLTTYGDGRWVLMFKDDLDRDREALEQAIHRAIGRSDIAVEIITAGRWSLSGLVSYRFSKGRVFLVGDAAHTLPPSRGGYGANTGIADAHNLVWKLASVLSGKSRMALLNSYDAERRPVAWLRHQQIFARPDYRKHADHDAESEVILDDAAMEFGELYRSKVIIGAGGELPPARRPDEWAGQPGTRAPHFWIVRDGVRLSTLDFFQGDWTLLTEDEGWCNAARDAGHTLGLPVACFQIGVDVAIEDIEAFRAAFGLPPTGAMLIRPDGYIGWRETAPSIDPNAALRNALATAAAATAAQGL